MLATMQQDAAQQTVQAWLDRFNVALGATERLPALFRPDGHWRDIVGLTWTIATVSGREAVAAALPQAALARGARTFAIDHDRYPPRMVERAGEQTIEAILRFDTAIGAGAGILRIKAADTD